MCWARRDAPVRSFSPFEGIFPSLRFRYETRLPMQEGVDTFRLYADRDLRSGRRGWRCDVRETNGETAGISVAAAIVHNAESESDI